MKYSDIITIMCAAGMLAAGTAGYAQSDSNVYNERVVVTSRYKPVVEESQKVNVAPVITDTVATVPKKSHLRYYHASPDVAVPALANKGRPYYRRACDTPLQQLLEAGIRQLLVAVGGVLLQLVEEPRPHIRSTRFASFIVGYHRQTG